MADFKHKKKLGQNFLNDVTVIEDTLELAKIFSADVVLEIGPGEGVLTEKLLQVAKKVICIELDERLYPILEKKFSSFENFQLIKADVLSVDFLELLTEKSVVVANIPYYITGPIIQKIIAAKASIHRAFLMVQKEVGERLTARPGSSSRGVLTLSVELFGGCKYHFTVPKEKFTPPPKVDSAIIEIFFHVDNPFLKNMSEKEFFQGVKLAFSQKRKKMINVIVGLFGVTKLQLSEIYVKMGLDENIRAEGLSIEQFVRLFEYIKAVV
ncbi:MAG: 16S rRNA (adenine(1518)-N(6)/adenine(1519)-N(6))-dimethyltransferase RsmA [Fusobacteria bacterium]|nr:16S rRNA (adenine(1518)-N(6)/adenine(1519)-N(6))-dimethyltransferase RsmA [Fusobacteriota bacterium]